MTVFDLVEWVCIAIGGSGTLLGIVVELRGNVEAADRIAWRTGWAFGFGLLVAALELNVEGDLGRGAVFSVLGALSLWQWWNQHRKRRRRIADRIAARVRDLGHRLVVEPVPVGVTR